MTATAARDIFPGEDWAFHNHRTLAEVATQGRPGISRPDVGRRNTIRRKLSIGQVRVKLLDRVSTVGRVVEGQLPDHDFDNFLNEAGW